MEKKTYLAGEGDEGKRIDRFLSEADKETTRSFFQRLLEEGQVFVSGKAVSKSHKVKAGDRIEAVFPAPKELSVKAQEIPLDIVFEDKHLLVVNKEKGMVVHPAAGHFEGTLVNALLRHCEGSLSGINGVVRPGIVHRIDKDTSGLLIVAKTNLAHIALAEQIKTHSFRREYIALVRGNWKEDGGTIDAPIGRHKTDRKRRAVTVEHAKNAVTHFEVLERYEGYSLLRCVLETGRTHQIRVHMAYRGHSIVGDGLYGTREDKKMKTGQFLHAALIGFLHPVSGEYLEFSRDIPQDFKDFLLKLKKA